MPDFPIVDAHVHLIDPERVPLSWGDKAPSINKRFTITNLDKAAGKTEIEAAVFVEVDVVAGRHLDEINMVESMAESDPRIGAIVAHAPLHLGDAVQSDLDLMSAHPLVRGVRRLLQNESDPAFCLQESFLAGVRALPARDLHFEICILHHQAEAAVELVRRCPDVRFMLDHIAKPGIKAGLLDPWRDHLRAMAELPNVTCKLSGVVTEADHDHWTPEELQPYIDHVVECFGFERLCYGGDWPVVTFASEYSRWIETLDAALSGVSSEDLRKLYRDNAVSFYRLAI